MNRVYKNPIFIIFTLYFRKVGINVALDICKWNNRSQNAVQYFCKKQN